MHVNFPKWIVSFIKLFFVIFLRFYCCVLICFPLSFWSDLFLNPFVLGVKFSESCCDNKDVIWKKSILDEKFDDASIEHSNDGRSLEMWAFILNVSMNVAHPATMRWPSWLRDRSRAVWISQSIYWSERRNLGLLQCTAQSSFTIAYGE